MKKRIAVQLYSIRNEMEKDPVACLRRVRAIGYEGVELAGFHRMVPEAFREHLDTLGLEVVGNHIAIPSLEDVSRVVQEQRSVGISRVVVSQPPDAFPDEEAVRKVARRMNELGRAFLREGIHLGLHNHWWEFRQKFGNRTVFDLLFHMLSDDVFFEVDIYWAVVGGIAPADIAKQYRHRVELLHVKDGPAKENLPMTALGQGTLDVVGATKVFTDAQWNIVELDSCAGDMFTALEESFQFMVDQGLAQRAEAVHI